MWTISTQNWKQAYTLVQKTKNFPLSYYYLTRTFRSTKLFLVLWSSIRLTNRIADVSWSFSVLGTNSNQEANSCKHKCEKTISGILSLRYIFEIRHFTNEKGNEAVMCPAVVSGIFTGNAPVSYWPVFFPVPCNSAKQQRGKLRPSYRQNEAQLSKLSLQYFFLVKIQLQCALTSLGS